MISLRLAGGVSAALVVIGGVAHVAQPHAAHSGAPVVAWYVNPDNSGQTAIAERCTMAARGRYTIRTSPLPRSANDQREQLLRRLAAKDSSIDLMSLDVAFVPEFAEAGFLAPIPATIAKSLTDDVVGPAVVGATWHGRLAAAPMWANTQLLWYRKSVARRSGLDPSKTNVTWDQIVRAARKTHGTVAIQAKRYEGYAVLINALIESAGGHIIENPGASADDVQLGIDSSAGKRAAATIHEIAHAGVGGPSLSTSEEEAARALFQGSTGGFMVNWPYVWRAANDAVADKSLSSDVVSDIGWARYPRVLAGTASRPPLGGIDLAVGRWSKHVAAALDAIGCITSAGNERYYFLHEGNPSARSSVYDDAAVRKLFPMASLIRSSLEASAPRPRTQYYGDVSAAILRKFHPPEAVDAGTPAAAQSFVQAVLLGDRLP